MTLARLMPDSPFFLWLAVPRLNLHAGQIIGKSAKVRLTRLPIRWLRKYDERPGID